MVNDDKILPELNIKFVYRKGIAILMKFSCFCLMPLLLKVFTD